MSRPPYSSTSRRVMSSTAASLVTSTATASARRSAVRRRDLLRDLASAVAIEVGDDDVRATVCKQAGRGAADPARAAGDRRATLPASSPRGGACASLYRSSGQYSIANASLSLSERKPPSASAASSTAIARW